MWEWENLFYHKAKCCLVIKFNESVFWAHNGITSQGKGRNNLIRWPRPSRREDLLFAALPARHPEVYSLFIHMRRIWTKLYSLRIKFRSVWISQVERLPWLIMTYDSWVSERKSKLVSCGMRVEWARSMKYKIIGLSRLFDINWELCFALRLAPTGIRWISRWNRNRDIHLFTRSSQV